MLKAIIFTQGIALSDLDVVIEAKDMFLNNSEVDLKNEFDVIAVWEEVNFQDENGVFVSESLMAVKEWGGFISTASNNLFELNAPPNNCPSNQVHWAKGDAGIKGQGGVDDPLSLHINHTWLNYNGTYYDPSYGIKLPGGTEDTYKANNLDTEGGLIYKVTFNTGEVKHYYWIGQF